MLAQKELLDQLMGKDRNLVDDEKNSKRQLWTDEGVCHHFIASFCPHDLFTNTKSDIGPCAGIHEEELRRQFQGEPDHVKLRVTEEFMRFLASLCDDVDRRIRRGTTRLNQTVEPNRDDPAFQAREKQINELNEKLKTVIEQMEQLGEEGKVDESQALLPEMEKLQESKQQLVDLQEAGQRYVESHEKAMEVCEVCGAFLIQSDAEARVLSHLNGKQHLGYKQIREKLAELREQMPALRALAAKHGGSGGGAGREREERVERPRERERERDRRPRYRSRSRSPRRDRDYRRGGDRRRSYDDDRRGGRRDRDRYRR